MDVKWEGSEKAVEKVTTLPHTDLRAPQLERVGERAVEFGGKGGGEGLGKERGWQGGGTAVVGRR